MANTYNTTQETAGITPVYGPGAFMMTFSLAVPSAGFGLNDVVNLVQIPANCALIDFFIDLPQLDSNGAPAITIDIGDGGSAQRFVAASPQFGRSTTSTILSPEAASAVGNGGWVQGSLPRKYTAADNLKMKIHAAPATAVTTGTITGYALFWGGQNQ